MMLRIRQVAFAADRLEATVDQLRRVLGLSHVFVDPGVDQFGLRNTVMLLGDQFLEVVSPHREATAAGRLLQRRGDSGYMVLFETDDFEAHRANVSRLGVRVVWQAALRDIQSMHLHPKDVGGTIVSLDQPSQRGEWRWGGPHWKQHANPAALALVALEIEAESPEHMAQRWAEVLGLDPPEQEGRAWTLKVTGGRLRFVPAGARGEGLSGVSVAVPDVAAALRAAGELGLDAAADVIRLCGTDIRLLSSTTLPTFDV
jgi:hypothetical protein